MSWKNIIKKDIKDIEDRAKSFILETVKRTPYATIVNNNVILKPEWLESFDPYEDLYSQVMHDDGSYYLMGTTFDYGERIKHFYFNLNNIHLPQVCIYAETVDKNDETNQRQICLSQGLNPNAAVPADFYVSAIMIMGNKEQFLGLWDD